ncbi:hypothetical protein AB0G00_10190 [Nocardia salmonicida]|uniref:hypothetical protein n=1 Tax=Nocardia salmonicida TaxID=53431 RepID=UPI0034075011
MITDRGEDAFVLLSIDEYRRLKADSQDLVCRLSMDDEIELEPAPRQVGLKVAGQHGYTSRTHGPSAMR